MFPDDDPRFHFDDDPRPPEPDTVVLQRVVARGRQRLFRRRALFGGVAVAIAAVVIASGAAVAQHHSAGPGVEVQSPGDVAVGESTTTTTIPLLTTPTTTGGASQTPVSTPLTNPAGQSCAACGANYAPPPETQAATPGDFTGEVKVSPAVVTAGEDVGVELDVLNATAKYVDVEGMTGGPATAVVCTNDLTSDGYTSTPLHNENPDANIFWIVAPVLDPLQRAGIGPMTVQTTAAEVGTVTCEAVLVGAHHDGLAMTSYIISRITNIPAVTYTVLPATDTSSTTTTTTETSTTVPETTVPSP
jgi:hypothetical protein